MEWQRAGSFGALTAHPSDARTEVLAVEWLAELFSEDLLGRLTARWTRHGASGLAPGPGVDAALGRLVSIIGGANDDRVVAALRPRAEAIACAMVDACPRATRDARALRRMAACAEAEMEHGYATTFIERLSRAVAASRTVTLAELLQAFPYTDNYARLVAAELQMLTRGSVPLRGVAVGGAGPLPLTGWLLVRAGVPRVVLIDRDARALSVLRRLSGWLERAGAVPSGRLVVEEGDVGEVALDVSGVDAVIVASLVDDAAKGRLAEQVARRALRRRLLFRGAEGLVARFAYRPLPDRIGRGLRRVAIARPRGVLNTIEGFEPERGHG